MHLPSWLPRSLRFGALTALTALMACAVSPTGDDIERAIQAQLRTATGSWTAVQVTGGTTPSTLTMSFGLAEVGGGQVTGSGRMQEVGAVPVEGLVVTGTFVQPTLSLAFDGMTYEGRAVRGTFRGQYTNIGGILDTLVLTGTGYQKRLPMLMQKPGP